MSGKGGSDWKRNFLEVIKHKECAKKTRMGVLDVFEGARKGRVRDSNADEEINLLSGFVIVMS